MDDLIQQFMTHLPYLGVVLVLLASGFGAPIPEDLPLIVGGYLCGIGKAKIGIMIPVVFVAVLGADLIVYFLGRRYGHHVPRLPLLRHYLSESRLAKAEISFHKHGGKTLFLARFMPGLRAPIYFSAGAFKLPFWKMLAFDGSAALLSVPIWLLVPYYFAEKVNIQTLFSWSFTTQVMVAMIIVLILAGALGWRFWRRRKLASAG